MIKGNVARIKGLALNLLNYAKEREPDYRLCDPNRPLQEVFDLMLPRARDAGVELIMELDINLSDVWFDPEGIHRCLLNLVTNALDACTDIRCSNRACRVVLRAAQREGWAVEYQVEDNGCGMDADTKVKVFQQFFSTKGSRGTGLGLMIARKIIDEHGGTIRVVSEEDQGATFYITLPVKKMQGLLAPAGR